MSRECQILFLMVLICIAIPLVSSGENCERSEYRKQWTVTCDSQTHQRDFCSPGQKVNDPCSSDNVCEYCPAGQFQNVYTNCKTCKNCTTLDHCCPGQELIRQCASDEDAKCGCPEHTPTTCPTCPSVCNTTNQPSTSDDTPVWIPSSDTDGTTSSPTSAKDTLSSGCKCVGWKIGFALAALLCVILFGALVCLYNKKNGERGTKEEETGLVSTGTKTSNGSESEPCEEEVIDSDLAEGNVPESGEKKNAGDSQSDKSASGSTSQQSSSERDLNSAQAVESKGIPSPAKDLKKPGHELAAMDREVSLEDIEALSKKIGRSWQNIGKALRLTPSDIENIRDDNNKQEEVAYKILLTWKQRNGNSATYRVLVEALSSADRKDLGDDLEKKVNDPAAETDLLQ